MSLLQDIREKRQTATRKGAESKARSLEVYRELLARHTSSQDGDAEWLEQLLNELGFDDRDAELHAIVLDEARRIEAECALVPEHQVKIERLQGEEEKLRNQLASIRQKLTKIYDERDEALRAIGQAKQDRDYLDRLKRYFAGLFGVERGPVVGALTGFMPRQPVGAAMQRLGFKMARLGELNGHHPQRE